MPAPAPLVSSSGSPARSRWWAAPVTVVSLALVAGCSLFADDGSGGDGGQSEPEQEEQADPVTTRAINEWVLDEAEAQVELYRVDDEHMVATLEVTNHGDYGPLWNNLVDDHGTHQPGYEETFLWDHFSGLSWLDPDGSQLHKPFHLPDRSCLCSHEDDDDGAQRGHITEGETYSVYTVLAAPDEGVEALTLYSHFSLPFVDVPVQDGAPEGVDYTAPSDEPEAEPDTAELETVVDSPEETTVAGQEQTEMHLASDVLFDVDESELTDEAEQVLERAAEQIDAADPGEVALDGHTDSSGDDDINDPLSQDRAESVQQALEGLVSVDVDFSAEGHGSSDPIADNDSEDGKARNRRVTATMPVTLPAPREHEGDDAADDGDGAQAQGTPVEEFAPVASPEGDFEVTLTELRQVSDGVALLSYRVDADEEAEGPVDPEFAYSYDRWLEMRHRGVYAVWLTDPGSERVSSTLRVHPVGGGGDPWCACSPASGVNLGSERMEAGESREFFALMPLPGDQGAAVDVSVADLDVFEGVAVEP